MDEIINSQCQTPRKEASPESIAKLRDNFNVHISLMGQTLENSMPVYKSCLELLKDPLLADNPYLLNLKIVYEVAITYYLAELDNAAIFHADFTRRSDNLYRRTLLLQCYRVFSEATKALFGFGKDQRNALWGKLTSTIDLSSFSTELEEISAGVERLKSDVINKDARDFASHYDWDTLATASFFTSLDDEELVCRDWNQYLYISERLSFILSKIFAEIASRWKTGTPVTPSESNGIPPTTSGTEIRWCIEKRLLNQNLVNAIQSTYGETEKQLDTSIFLCRKYKALCDIAEKYAPNIKEDFALQSYQKTLNAVGVLAFMTNDAHAAAIALTDSTSFWESRMHLKRLDVAAYEALDKIVGFTEASKQESLFQMLDSIVIDLPAAVQERYSALKEETKSLIKRYGLQRSRRRCSFVHYRSKKQLWLVQTYDNLLSISALEALAKVIEIRNLTTSIIRFVTLFAGAFNQLEEQRSDQRIRDQFQQFRDLMGKIKDNDARNSALQTLDTMEHDVIILRNKARYKP